MKKKMSARVSSVSNSFNLNFIANINFIVKDEMNACNSKLNDKKTINKT